MPGRRLTRQRFASRHPHLTTFPRRFHLAQPRQSHPETIMTTAGRRSRVRRSAGSLARRVALNFGSPPHSPAVWVPTSTSHDVSISFPPRTTPPKPSRDHHDHRGSPQPCEKVRGLVGEASGARFRVAASLTSGLRLDIHISRRFHVVSTSHNPAKAMQRPS